MKQHAWKYARAVLAAVGLVGALVSCNSHVLLKSGDPEVVVIDPPVFISPPPPLADAGVTNPWKPVDLTPLPDAAPSDDPQPVQPPGPDAAVTPPGPDAAPDLPPTENFKCAAGLVRVHVRDLWSNGVDPTMGTLTAPPTGVLITDPISNYMTYGARVDGVNCTYYSVCMPNTITKIQVKPIGANSCPVDPASGNFDVSSLAKNSSDIWIEYNGTSATLRADYSAYPTATGPFNITSNSSTLKHPACTPGAPPDETTPAGYTKIHFRWPFGDPVKTGYPGSGCGEDKLGYTPPPYPSSLKVTGFQCEMQAMLELQDGSCPWYYVLVPNSMWPTTGTVPQIVFRYPDDSKGLYTNNIALPPRTASEYWIGYAGAPDNTIASATKCMDWSLQTNTYFVYTANPGPGYAGCGGAVGPVDPCYPPQPSGYHSVHFRYIWAGQKTFTFFPKPALMPKWIEMEVNSTGSALKVICYREQDRPWYDCPVPDTAFTAGATWRAVDKLHVPEWNTVAPHPFPATPGDYWIRWYYGKPDIPRAVDPPNFMVYNYYPDGTNGDWSATGLWNDSMCAPKPPATPVTVGFGNGAWFPYKKTNFLYPYGGSLAYIYPNSATVQDLFNAFVWERYQIWKQNYIIEGANACGAGTARVHTDPPETVSEGQGYGIAISAAIGDKALFDELWNFVRHFRSEQLYCGLMGWMWQGTGDCQPLDQLATNGGNRDSAFDGDVDIAIGLVYAALQWPEYTNAATDWLVRMEGEINTKYDNKFNYPTKGDSWNKNCQSGTHCDYDPGTNSEVFMDYYPPGYFRVFGDFLAAHQPASGAQAANGQTHHDFWYKTAETVYNLLEKCYDQAGLNPGLVGDSGNITAPCSAVGGGQPYEWGRSLWRIGIDAAWFGDNAKLPENMPNSSTHYGPKSQMQAKIDNAQNFYTNFYKNNPVEPNANRFSSICDNLGPSGTVTNCDPAYGHNSYTVNLAMCSYASLFDNAKATTSDIRREAIEESISTTVENDRYFQESLGVYSILFLTGNFPNPTTVPAN